MALAIEMAGKMCPPVPPPLMIILKLLSILLCFYVFAKVIKIFIMCYFYCDYFVIAVATVGFFVMSSLFPFFFAERLMLRITPI